MAFRAWKEMAISGFFHAAIWADFSTRLFFFLILIKYGIFASSKEKHKFKQAETDANKSVVAGATE